MQPKPIEVHNVWTIYGLNEDGSRAEQPFACAGQRHYESADGQAKITFSHRSKGQ